MNIETFKTLTPYEQEMILLLTRIVKSLESIAREDAQ